MKRSRHQKQKFIRRFPGYEAMVNMPPLSHRPDPFVPFRAENSDAAVLQREFDKSYAMETFVGLDRFQVIARLSQDGQTREPFCAQTLPPIEHQVGRREKLIGRPREKYAAKRADVEAKIDRWMEPISKMKSGITRGRIPFLPL